MSTYLREGDLTDQQIIQHAITYGDLAEVKTVYCYSTDLGIVSLETCSDSLIPRLVEHARESLHGRVKSTVVP